MAAQRIARHVTHHQAGEWWESECWSWTNDAEKVDGGAYFNYDQTGIDGFGPLLRKQQHHGYRWLCKDYHGNYYISDMGEAILYAYKNPHGHEKGDDWAIVNDLFMGDFVATPTSCS